MKKKGRIQMSLTNKIIVKVLLFVALIISVQALAINPSDDDSYNGKTDSEEGLFGSSPPFVFLPLRFSHPSGFYENEFLLQIHSEEESATIRYTLDGTLPDETSLEYAEGILISPDLIPTNTISSIPTATSWAESRYGGPAAVIVRAQAFKDDFQDGDVLSAAFFVVQKDSFEHTLPVISLITEPDNLFDDERGIYVTGNAAHGNFHQRGRDWERPAVFTFFDERQNLEYEGNVGLRIHGGTSRNFPQKSMRMYFRNEYGDSWWNYEVFPGYPVKNFKRLILRQTGHDMWFAYMRDAFMQSLLEGTRQDLQGSRPSVLYINGEYWGLHYIRERYDKYYLQSHHQIDPDNIDLMAHTNLHVDQGDDKHYWQMLEFIENNCLSEDENFSVLSNYMDIESYTDYKIAEIFFYRWDIGNIRFWRSRDSGSVWQWMMFDLDTGYGGFWSIDNPWEFDMLKYNTEETGAWTQYLGHNHNSPDATFLLRKLFKNEGYRQQFATRFADLLNTNFQPWWAIQKMDSVAALIISEIPSQALRWNALESYDSWLEELEYMRDFAELRPAFQRAHLTRFFGLQKEMDLHLDVSNQLAGHIRVNSVAIVSGNPGVKKLPYPWNGKYFAGLPLELEAIPAAGFEFSHWEGDHYFTEATIKLEPQSDVNLKAVFNKKEQPELLYYWFFGETLPNDQPLEYIKPVYALSKEAMLDFTSALEGYPYYPGHPHWRVASMERRNSPTSLNYIPAANENKPFVTSGMRGIQIRQPFSSQDRHSFILLNMPIEGFHNPVLQFAAKDEGMASKLILEYKCGMKDSVEWKPYEGEKFDEALNTQWQLFSYSFSDISGTGNCTELMVKIRFETAAPANDEHISRVVLNNIGLKALPLDVYTINATATGNGSITPSGYIPVYQEGVLSFAITPGDNARINDVLLNGESVYAHLQLGAEAAMILNLEDIDMDHKLVAVFEDIPDPLTETDDPVRVYPNPASGYFSVYSPVGLQEINIYDLNGHPLKSYTDLSGNHFRAKVPFLLNGIYILKIKTLEGLESRKLNILKY